MNIAAYGFAIWETFYVTVLSTAFALVLGLPLGVLLVAGDKDGILPLPGWLMHLINIVINIPVSYTHLDVYKRQGCRSSCRPDRREKQCRNRWAR